MHFIHVPHAFTGFALFAEYAGELMRQTELIAAEGDKNLRNTLPELEPMEALCSRYEHPDKNEAVIAARSRGRFASSSVDR